MIGTKFYKDNYDQEKYTECAEWCNSNGGATIEDKGEYYECVAIPEPTLEAMKANKLSELDTFIANKITGGFTSECTGTAVKYDSDTDTQITMQGIALNADSIAAKYPAGVPVRGYVAGAAEKTVQYLSGVQLLAWCADLSLHIGACKQLGWQKQAEINAAETKEALEAITF